jgi:cold shock CspA family protein
MRPARAPGEVADFDEAVGLGTVRDERGRTFAFHCTQIADGSRSVAGGTRVEFDVVPGHLGRWEAAALRPC